MKKREAQMHFVIGRHDQPQRPLWVVSIPLWQAKFGDASIFHDQMVHIELETRNIKHAEATANELNHTRKSQ